MLSAIICYKLSYSTMPLVWQSIHHRFTFPGPLVLGFNLFNFLTLTVDRDQTVSRRSKLRSCTAFLGEQPNPWNRLQLQDAIMLRSSECYHSALRFKTVRECLHSYGSSQTVFKNTNRQNKQFYQFILFIIKYF